MTTARGPVHGYHFFSAACAARGFVAYAHRRYVLLCVRCERAVRQGQQWPRQSVMVCMGTVPTGPDLSRSQVTSENSAEFLMPVPCRISATLPFN